MLLKLARNRAFQSALKSQHQFARPSLLALPKRGIIEHLGLESAEVSDSAVAKKAGGADSVALWKEQQDKQEKGIVLQDTVQIEHYVLNAVRQYFRTTRRAALHLESDLKKEHGLDSLDLIELVMQVEDDLGYVIEPENLERFQKPKHFVNFITHMEAYKAEFNKLPHEGIHEEFDVAAAFKR